MEIHGMVQASDENAILDLQLPRYPPLNHQVIIENHSAHEGAWRASRHTLLRCVA